MELARPVPRGPSPFPRRPFVELDLSRRGDSRSPGAKYQTLRGQYSASAPSRKSGGSSVEAGQNHQSAQIGQMMNPESLFSAVPVVCHHGPQVSTGSTTPRTTAREPGRIA